MRLRLALRTAAPVLAAVALFGAPVHAGTAPPDTKPADVYAPGKVWQVHITLSADEFAAIQPRGGRGFGFGPPAKEPPPKIDPKREVHRNNFGMDLPWGVGSVTIEGTTFAQVGIRYKGNGTIGDSARTIKKSFKIDLDRAGGDDRFAGARAINLHCEVTDPSKCRETLGYDVYRAAGVPAPRTALAEVRLTVPGKYDREVLGVYTIVEEVDKPFLRDRFGTDKGLLMKPEGARDFEDRGEDWDRYKKAFAPKRDATKEEGARLVAFAKLVHKADDATFNKQIDSYLDVDNYLRFLAATAFVANTDSFFVLGHNYNLYLHPKTNKLHFVPWDLDRSFANFPILGSNTQQMNLSLTKPYAGTHRLTERVLAVPGASEKYQKLLKDLSATAFDKERLLKKLAATEATAKDALERDTKAAAARKEQPGGFGPPGFGKPPTLPTFIEKRTASVAAQVAGTSNGYVPTGGFGFGGPPKLGPLLAAPMLEAMDTNKDDKISRDEWLASAKRLFEACEKDKDGSIDLKALTAGLNKQTPPPAEGAPRFDLASLIGNTIFERADANKDGKVTADELQTAARGAFEKFEKGKPGPLDEDAFAELLTELFPMPKFGPPMKK